MKKFKLINVFLAGIATMAAFTANAQEQQDWLTNTMFESGKINVVVAVVAVVFILLVIYLISIDRKLSKIEKQTKEK